MIESNFSLIELVTIDVKNAITVYPAIISIIVAIRPASLTGVICPFQIFETVIIDHYISSINEFILSFRPFLPSHITQLHIKK